MACCGPDTTSTGPEDGFAGKNIDAPEKKDDKQADAETPGADSKDNAAAAKDAKADEPKETPDKKDEGAAGAKKKVGTTIDEDPKAMTDAKKTAAVNNVIESLWAKYDTDKSADIDPEEFKKLFIDTLKEKGMGDKFDDKKFEKIFNKFDKDKSGKLEKDEFSNFIKEFVA